MIKREDRDPTETREWLDALDSVEAFEGVGRVDELLDGVIQAARRKGADSRLNPSPTKRFVSKREQPAQGKRRRFQC